MSEGPLLDEFMRHLQASLDEAMDIEAVSYTHLTLPTSG